MSSRAVSVFCQVGFSPKKGGKDPYFHSIDGRDFGGKIEIGDGVNYLSPFSVEDLVTGNIPYDLLPAELQSAIGEVAQRTFAAIERVNPEFIKRDQIGSIAIKFQLSQNGGTDGVEDEGGTMLN